VTAIPLLGELELAVLDYAWSHDETDAKEVHRALGVPRKITLNTIQSTLERLHRKGLLTRERVSHAYRYRPLLSRDEFRARAAAHAAGELRGAQAGGVLAAFVDLAMKADRANLDRLESIIAAARARRRERQ
jgi:predicted transcriptional regulator